MKHKSNSNLMLLLTAALVIVAGIYFWRKKTAVAQPDCKEICYSTSDEQDCSVICVPPTEAPAA